MGLAQFSCHLGDLAQQLTAMPLTAIQWINKDIFHIAVVKVTTVPNGRVLIADEHHTSRVLNDGLILQGAAKPLDTWQPFAQSQPLASAVRVLSYPSPGSPANHAQTACHRTAD